MTTPTRGGKRKGSGRKPMEEKDKKKLLRIYPITWQVDQLGGEAKTIEEVMKFIDKKTGRK